MNRKQNKGFTLVEVLIAITILGIIVTPLLHAFVTSVNTNAKARRVMDATTLAQNIIEDLKAGSLEDLARQFNGCEGDDVITVGDDLTVYEEEPQDYKIDESKEDDDLSNYLKRLSVRKVGTEDLAEGEKPKGVFIGQPNGEYSFTMRNVPMGNTSYDVVIGVNESEKGKQDLSHVYSMNQSDCGYFAQTENMDQRAAAEFQIRNAAYVYEATTQKTVAEFMGIMKRVITISLQEHVVDVTYSYEIPRGYTAENDRKYSETTRIYEDLSEELDLKAVYLCYYPLYSSRGDAESIVIENMENLDVDVFLIKMDVAPPENMALMKQMPSLDVKETLTSKPKSYVRVNANWENGTYILLNNKLQFTPNFANIESVTSLYDVTVEVYRYQEDETLAFATEYLIGSYTGSFMDDSQIEQ